MNWKEAIKILKKNDSKNVPVGCFICERCIVVPIVAKYDPNNIFSMEYDPNNKDSFPTSAVSINEKGIISKVPILVLTDETLAEECTGKIIQGISYEEVDKYYESV